MIDADSQEQCIIYVPYMPAHCKRSGAISLRSDREVTHLLQLCHTSGAAARRQARALTRRGLGWDSHGPKGRKYRPTLQGYKYVIPGTKCSTRHVQVVRACTSCAAMRNLHRLCANCTTMRKLHRLCANCTTMRKLHRLCANCTTMRKLRRLRAICACRTVQIAQNPTLYTGFCAICTKPCIKCRVLCNLHMPIGTVCPLAGTICTDLCNLHMYVQFVRTCATCTCMYNLYGPVQVAQVRTNCTCAFPCILPCWWLVAGWTDGGGLWGGGDGGGGGGGSGGGGGRR
jgi:uncharacterized membrane protein YgcG